LWNIITAVASIELYYGEYTESNGEWESDPNTQSTVNFKNESIRNGLLSRDGKIAVASSVTVFTVASILFFIVGFLCGHFCQKKRKSSTAAGETVTPAGSGGARAAASEASAVTGSGGSRQTQTPHDDVVIQQEEVELKENVAYGPLTYVQQLVRLFHQQEVEELQPQSPAGSGQTQTPYYDDVVLYNRRKWN
jgi:hypothetical protein